MLPRTPSFRLDRRRALVTGAGRGIGAGAAAALADAGAVVTLVFDILVNSAGMNRPALLTETSDEDLAAALDLNVRATFFVCREVARGMIGAGNGGSIATISSQMGHVGGPSRSLYCASKWALEGMNKAFALDLAPLHDQALAIMRLVLTALEIKLTVKPISAPISKCCNQSIDPPASSRTAN